jgi:23S rRNA (uracil1939-C5)-methyltransferase
VQRADKAAKLGALLAEVGIALAPRAEDLVTPAALAFRGHLDLRLEDGRLGLIGTAREVIDTERAAREVIDMPRCEVATPALNAWLAGLRTDLPPVPRASLRLRVGPDGTRGLWIDCAHEHIKSLLDEARWLARQVEAGVVVELGAKSRRVVVEPGESRVRLGAAELAVWSTSFAAGRALPLYTTIGGFSQPGPIANQALVSAVTEHVRQTSPKKVLELGAGAGNLTLPLLSAGLAVRAVELDGAALLRSARESQLDRQLEVVAASFQRASDVAPLVMGTDTLLADPPRQGLGVFLDGLGGLAKSLRPRAVVYVSCHPEALARDAARLTTLGYHLRSLTGIDQFPWTHHVEWLATFER